MSNLIAIVSKTGKCLCKGCPLFLSDQYDSCPVSRSTENLSLIGEALPKYDVDDMSTDMWCNFNYCGIDTGDTDNIKNNPGYRIKGFNDHSMWFPESIVEPIKKEKQKIKRKTRSLLARLGTKT